MEKNIRVEEVGDINSDYPYLEFFFKKKLSPFMEVAIFNRELTFKLYSTNNDISLNREDWEFILKTANEFLPRVLKNEDDYLGFLGRGL